MEGTTPFMYRIISVRFNVAPYLQLKNLFLWHLVLTKRHIAISNSVGLSVFPGFATLGTSRKARTIKFGKRIRDRTILNEK